MTMTVEDIVVSLREMLDANRGSNTLTQWLAGGSLTVLYEFKVPDGGEVVPYTLTVAGDRRTIEPGSVPYDDADIVIRTEPLTLHRLTNGDLSGREAIVGGLLDIRRAPSMPKLLLMRSLLNRYKKARLRGDLNPATPAGDGGEDGDAGEGAAGRCFRDAIVEPDSDRDPRD